MRVTQRLGAIIGSGLAMGTLVALGGPAAAATHSRSRGSAPVAASVLATPMRPLPDPLYGVTVDSVADLSDIVAGSRALGEMPVTRIYFDVKEPATYYAPAVRTIQPVSYIMGELLDSSDSRRISAAAYNKRVKSYVSLLGNSVDVWEVGNEVNGNWTGRYSTVEKKLTDAYDDVTSVGERTALTLYYNIGCGDGRKELDPMTFSQRYVPSAVRNGLDYVLLSYYESDCNGIRPSAATWTATSPGSTASIPTPSSGSGRSAWTTPPRRPHSARRSCS